MRCQRPENVYKTNTRSTISRKKIEKIAQYTRAEGDVAGLPVPKAKGSRGKGKRKVDRKQVGGASAEQEQDDTGTCRAGQEGCKDHEVEYEEREEAERQTREDGEIRKGETK